MGRILSVIMYLAFVFSARGSDRISLPEYLARVREANLGLKIENTKIEASDARSVGVALPPPMVAYAQMKDAAGTSRGFEINQTIPFPTKLSSDHSARKAESRSQKEMSLANQREVLSQAKQIYFSLWAVQEKIVVLYDKKNILQNHVKLSRSGVRSDSFLKIHLLKSESDLDLLENEIEETKQALREAKVRAAEFVNADISNFDVLAVEPPKSKPPGKAKDSDHSHQVESKKFALEGFKAWESNAKSSWLPDLSLRYKKMGPGSMFGQYNEVMVGVSLPFVFFWEPNSASKEAGQKRLQAELELEQEKRKIERESYTLLQKITSLNGQLENIEERLIPRAKTRMGLVHNIVPRDMESLQDHRETMEAFPELRLKALELRLAYEGAISEFEKFDRTEVSEHE